MEKILFNANSVGCAILERVKASFRMGRAGLLVRTVLILLAISPIFRADAQMHTFTGGTSSNVYPFSDVTNNMVQWIFQPADFLPASPAGSITKIYIMPSTGSASASYTNLTIKMGNTALTTLTTGPFITGLTTVFTANTYTFPPITAGVWIPIILQTPFAYNATSNIILEISQTAYTGGFNLRQESSVAGVRLYGNVVTGTGTVATGKVNFGFDIVSVLPCSGTPAPSVITNAPLAGNNCNGVFTLTATTPLNATNFAHQWEQAPSATGPWTNAVGGTGATTLSYTTPNITSSTWYRIKTTCPTSAASSTSNPYAITASAPSLGLITGDSTFCPTNSKTFTVPPASTATSYAWTLPPGWTGTSTTNSITAVAGTTAGNITVTASNACGTSNTSTFAVISATNPAQPAVPTGNNVVCAGATQAYSVPPITGAVTYTWTLPGGWSGTSTTNTITVTPSATAGNITVTANSPCGSSVPSILPVTVTTAAAPAPVVSGLTAVCANSSVTYTAAPVPGALSYTWTLPAGWVGTSATNTITVTTGATAGNITVRATNGCAPTGILTTYPVTITPQLTPTAAVSASDTTICANASVTFNVIPTNQGATPSYQWLVNGFPVATGPSYTTNTITNGNSVTVRLQSSYQCPSTQFVYSNPLIMIVGAGVIPGITVNADAYPTICAGSTVDFVSIVNGAGATPVYQWMRNNTAVGTNMPIYTATNIASGDSIYCILTSSDACATAATVTSNKLGVTVLQTVNPSVTISANPGTTVQNGQSITFTATGVNGGTAPLYQWTKNSADIPGATGPTYTTNTLRAGDQIRVRYTSQHLCASPAIVSSGILTIQNPTSVNSLEAGIQQLTLAPNPNKGSFKLAGIWNNDLIGKQVRVVIQNVLGQTVYTSMGNATSGNWVMDIKTNNLAGGMYMLQIAIDGEKLVRRFEIAQ